MTSAFVEAIIDSLSIVSFERISWITPINKLQSTTPINKMFLYSPIIIIIIARLKLRILKNVHKLPVIICGIVFVGTVFSSLKSPSANLWFTSFSERPLS